ncbi:MAG TPA: hypothetical protein VMY37_16830 [Thermoguttaceae bacterium]|nr:hypothetical protein [Thermoguttaceae bacterium]
MPRVILTRDDFLQDRQGKTFADVVNDPDQPFDAVLTFFNDEDRQRRMEGSEIHHERARLVEVVWELETQPLIESFLSSRQSLRAHRLREAVGVVVRMVVERLGREKTGKKGSLVVRATVLPRTATPVCPEDRYRLRDQGFGGYLSLRSKTMNTFRVWIRPLYNVCRVRVDGMKNAMWLLTRLSQSFVFKSSEAMEDDEGASCSTFHVPYNSQMSHFNFERLLAGIPQVQLMSDPA